MNKIILAINMHDIVRPLGIQFRLFTYSACDTKYRNWCTYVTWVQNNAFSKKL